MCLRCGSDLTSLQGPLGDLVAEGAQTGTVVGRHLDLIVGPDDEILQQQVGHIWTGDVPDLVIPWQTCQPVPNAHAHTHTTRDIVSCSTPNGLQGGDRVPVVKKQTGTTVATEMVTKTKDFFIKGFTDCLYSLTFYRATETF